MSKKDYFAKKVTIKVLINNFKNGFSHVTIVFLQIFQIQKKQIPAFNFYSKTTLKTPKNYFFDAYFT